MSEVDDYLWEVYQRDPVKKDSTGDFTWKDPAAAKRIGKSMPDYVIGGMDKDFREQLYHAGKAMDAAGLEWSMLSAFRDDYRQSIASGFKAEPCGSWHGGSCRTKGWGDGRAADLWIADANGYPVEDGSSLLQLIDKLGPSLGLSRPLPGADPPHVQVSGDWQLPQKATVRVAPQLSKSVTEPQSLPTRAQNERSDSGLQAAASLVTAMASMTT